MSIFAVLLSRYNTVFRALHDMALMGVNNKNKIFLVNFKKYF